MKVAEQLGGLLVNKGVAGDINQCLDMGWYRAASSNTTNAPNNYPYGMLIVLGSKTPYQRLAQLYMAVNNKLYYRCVDCGSSGVTEITKEWDEVQFV